MAAASISHHSQSSRSQFSRVVEFVVLLVAACAANAVPIPLFFSVEILLGSSIALWALYRLGLVAGVTVAAAAGALTILHWGHAYALITFVVEAVIIALLFRRGWNLIHASALPTLKLSSPIFNYHQ